MSWIKKISYWKLGLFIIVAILFIKETKNWFNLIKDFPLNDFSVYLDGTKAQLAGKNPYELWFFDRYNYPPFAAVLFLPLIWLPINAAEALFTLLSVISLWMVVGQTGEILKVKWSRLIKLIVFVSLLRVFPVRLTLALGQINLIILFLISASFYFYSKGKQKLSGFCLGLASAIKLTPIPLILFYLIKREKKVLISWIITMVVCLLVGWMAFGWPLTYYYYFNLVPKLLGETTRETLRTTYMNQSLAALLGRWGIFGGVNNWIRQAVNLIILGLVSWKIIFSRSHIEKFKAFILLTTAAILIWPVFVWQHHYVVLILPWLALVKWSVTKFNFPKLLIVVVSYLAMNFYFPDTHKLGGFSSLIVSHFLITGIALWILVFLTSICFHLNQNQIINPIDFRKRTRKLGL